MGGHGQVCRLVLRQGQGGQEGQEVGGGDVRGGKGDAGGVGRAEGGPGGGGRGADEVAQGAADGQVPQGALLAIQGRQAAPDEVLGSPTAPTSPLCRLDCRRVSAVAACSEVVCLCFARPIHPK